MKATTYDKIKGAERALEEALENDRGLDFSAKYNLIEALKAVDAVLLTFELSR